MTSTTGWLLPKLIPVLEKDDDSLAASWLYEAVLLPLSVEEVDKVEALEFCVHSEDLW